jgi:hypothetical protein
MGNEASICSSSRGDPGCGSLLDCQSSRAPVPLHRQPPERNPQRGISRLGGVQQAGATYTTVGGPPTVLPPGEVRERMAFQPAGPNDVYARARHNEYYNEPGARPVLDLQEERRRQTTQGADEMAEKRRQQAEQAVQQAQAQQQAQRELMAMQQQAEREKMARQQAEREQAVKAEHLAAMQARQQQAEREQMARQQATISQKSSVS